MDCGIEGVVYTLDSALVLVRVKSPACVSKNYEFSFMLKGRGFPPIAYGMGHVSFTRGGLHAQCFNVTQMGAVAQVTLRSAYVVGILFTRCGSLKQGKFQLATHA